METVTILKQEIGLWFNLFTIRSIMGYIFMASIPLSYMGVTIGGHLLFYEAVLIISLMAFFIELATGNLKIKITKLDVVILIYVFIHLISVCQGWDQLYVAAREYRWSLLSPLIVYFAYKLYFDNIQQILFSFVFFMLTLLCQLVIIIPAFLSEGLRPNTPFQILGVPLSLMFALVVIHLLTLKKIIKPYILKIVAIVLSILFLGGMLITMSRSPLIALIVSFFLAVTVFKYRILHKSFLISLVIFVGVFFMILTFIPESYLATKGSTVTPEIRKSIKRLYSTQFYVQELKGRMFFWKSLYQYGLKSPIFGRGTGAFQSIQTFYGPAHAHNILIHTFLNSGFVGILLFISIVTMYYSSLFSISRHFSARHVFFQMSRFYFIIFTILLMVGFTNDFVAVGYLMFFLFVSAGSQLYSLSQQVNMKKPMIS